MKAEEAKELANKTLKSDEIRGIEKAIKEAASNGKFEIWYYQSISEVTRQQLRSDGYSVGATQFDRNETLTKISWS